MDIHIRHLQSFGANTEAEAFTATKQAVYTAIYGRDVTDYSPIDSEEGRRTYEVYKKIVENSRKSESKFMEGTLKIRELSDWILVGENKDKIRKKIKVESNKKGKVNIRLESKVKDVKIIGLDNKEKNEIKANEEIYIEVDIRQIKENGKLKLNLEADLETNPIYLGEPGNTVNQPYAVSGIKVKGKTKASKEFYYKKNETKIKVKKIDGKTKEGLDNVEFELLDKDKKTIRKVKTDKNGNIIVDDILERKYYLKEVKAKNGYILDNKLIEIDIKYQENIDIEISNNKIEVKAEPKPKKVERILPVTGY